jgi:uncharacterized protein YbjT (DUF2867 family)
MNVVSVIGEQNSSPHMVIMSMGAADHDSPSGLARAHALSEELLQKLHVNFTAVRGSAFFYENVLALHSGLIAATGLLSNSFGDSRPAWISGTGVGDICADVLLNPERYTASSIIYPPGHEQLSQQEIADIISEETGREVRYKHITAEEWSRELEPFGVLSPETIKHLTIMARMCEDGTTILRSNVDPSALEAASGRAPLTFRNFVRQHRSAFGAT